MVFRKYELYCKPSKVGEGRYGEYKVNCPNMVYEIAKTLKMPELSREKVMALYMDTVGHLIGVVEISSGGLDGSIIDPKVVFGPALVMGKTAAVIMIHNHPSGGLEPSREDKEVTKRLQDAGRILGLRFEDHLIVSENGYFSFKEQGYIS